MSKRRHGRRGRKKAFTRFPGRRQVRGFAWVLLGFVAVGLLVSRFPDVEESSVPLPQPGGETRVTEVIDGDTIEVEGGRRIRFIGVDTPEMGYSPRAEREGVHDPLAEEAKRFVEALVEGERVRLEYGPEREDAYGRTLAYVYLEDGTLLNAALIRRGYATVYRRFEHPRREAFIEMEREARRRDRGIWGLEPGNR